MPSKLQAQQLVTTFAIWAALFMLVLWVLANMGLYVSAAQQMAKWHMFFDLSLTGLIGGMIEAAAVSAILTFAFVLVYNWVGKNVK